jgi:hypothetical protein
MRVADLFIMISCCKSTRQNIFFAVITPMPQTDDEARSF